MRKSACKSVAIFLIKNHINAQFDLQPIKIYSILHVMQDTLSETTDNSFVFTGPFVHLNFRFLCFPPHLWIFIEMSFFIYKGGLKLLT